MRVLTCADQGILVELDTLDAVLALRSAIAAAEIPGVIETVPAARTLLVRVDPWTGDTETVARAVRALRPREGQGHAPEGEEVRLPVVYDGADLTEVARLTGLTVGGVVAAHTSARWVVAFGGFAPGFGYLVSEEARLHVPRRRQPRTAVPAGAVGLAGEFSGVYPHRSPGGWRIIGRTERMLWDVERDPPALLRPGVRVRFEEVG